MNYVLKSSIKERRMRLPVKSAIVLGVLLVIFHTIFPRVLPAIFVSIVGPLWVMEKNIRQETYVSPVTENALMKALQDENTQLKQVLARKGDRALTLAYILKKPPFSAYDIFILDVGTADGVQIGNPVYALGNILIGEIAEASTPHISKVKLYSSFGEKFDVYIGPKSLAAHAIGRGGGAFEAELPRDSEVKEGDVITIPSLASGTFGTVAKVLSDPARPFATILFSQPLNLYEQKWVEVETGVRRIDLSTTTKDIYESESTL
jgi:hypothetical protein